MLEDRIFINDTIKRKMPLLIETFVSFYGEEHRERIEKKFNDLVLFGYSNFTVFSKLDANDTSENVKRFTSNPIRDHINEAKKIVAEEAIREFSKETGIYDRDRIKVLYGIFPGFEFPPIDCLYEDETKPYNQSRMISLVNYFYGTKYEKYDDPNFQYYLDRLKKYKPAYEQSKIKYKELYDEKIKKYQDYHDKLELLSNQILEKYQYKFLYEIYDYLPSKDKKILEDKEASKHLYNFDSSGVLIGPVNFYHSSLIDAFSSMSEEQINSSKVKPYIKRSILEDRINYFKRLGIDLGDNYEDYINNEEVKKIFPNREIADKVVEAKKKYGLEYRKELFLSLPHNQDSLETINKIDFIEKPDPFRMTGNDATCISTNYSKEEGKIVSRPILYMSSCLSPNSFDCNLCHELNHLYELEFLENKGNIFYSVSGWDQVEDEINLTGEVDYYYVEPKRDYELLNEIINEFIAQDICSMMHEKDIFVLSSKDDYSNKGHTGYERSLGRFTFRFYKEFKEDIIKSRIDNNIEHIYNVLGRENFEEYNKLLYDYYSKYPGDRNLQVLIDVKNNVDNRRTRDYYACMNKTNELLEKMIEHKNNYYGENVHK